MFKIKIWVYKKNNNWTPLDKNFDRDWTQDYAFIRNTNYRIGFEVTKRYARYVLSRNNFLVGIVILILSIFFNEKIIMFSLIFVFLFLFDAYTRRCWFLSYIQKISKKLKKPNN